MTLIYLRCIICDGFPLLKVTTAGAVLKLIYRFCVTGGSLIMSTIDQSMKDTARMYSSLSETGEISDPRKFLVKNLGESTFKSPLKTDLYRDDSQRILIDPTFRMSQDRAFCSVESPPSFELSGPRKKIHFNPVESKAAIVTCGGLCPGLNDVIHGIVMELWYHYHVKTIYGFKYGYQGMNPEYGQDLMLLTPTSVKGIHEDGGTILKSSRGEQPVDVCVDTLRDLGVNMLFCIGGDGTLRGAHDLHLEIEKRGLDIAIVGIPKTIDNDILWMVQSFGYVTAVSEAREAIHSAHTEATGAYNGIGIVKLMGRDSGYIAASATMAIAHVNFVLVPEVPFELHGAKGLLQALKERIVDRKHAVIVVAEGAGQDLLANQGETSTDASGNRLHKDIGMFLKDEIKNYFKGEGIPASIKYIDPSYIIRSVPANAYDSIYCMELAHGAVHAAMAGKTDVVIGRWGTFFTHVPIPAATEYRNKINPESDLWRSVLEATGQPSLMINDKD